MTILEENSKLLVDSIKELYLKGKYELEYAIVQLNKFYANGRVTKKDFEEYCEYFKAEKEKQNAVVVEEKTTEEQAEVVNSDVVQNDTEVVENTTADETAQNVENTEE